MDSKFDLFSQFNVNKSVGDEPSVGDESSTISRTKHANGPNFKTFCSSFGKNASRLRFCNASAWICISKCSNCQIWIQYNRL